MGALFVWALTPGVPPETLGAWGSWEVRDGDQWCAAWVRPRNWTIPSGAFCVNPRGRRTRNASVHSARSVAKVSALGVAIGWGGTGLSWAPSCVSGPWTCPPQSSDEGAPPPEIPTAAQSPVRRETCHDGQAQIKGEVLPWL